MYRIVVYLFLLFLLYKPTYTQTDIYFKHHTIDDGLVSDYIYSIAQDKKGFIWFGTRSGCSRFDGVRYKSMVQGQDYDVAAPARVNEMCLDKKGRLWFGTYGSPGNVLYFDYDNEKFIDISSYLEIPDRHPSLQVGHIMSDSRGYLWISTIYHGLIAYNYDTGHLLKFEHEEENPNSINFGVVTDVIEDANGDIIIGTSTGLNKLYFKSKKIVRINDIKDENNNVFDHSISCLLQENEDEIWVGTANNGFYKYNVRKNKLKKYEYDKKQTGILHKNINALYSDNRNNLWIGTSNGLYVMNKKTEVLKRYENDILNPESINDNIIKTIFHDRSGDIWVGTRVGADMVINYQFTTYKYTLNNNSVSHNKIQYLKEDQFKNIWICTPKGIDVFDRSKGTFKFLAGVGNKKYMDLSGAPLNVTEEENYGMWIGTWRGGVNFYDYKTNKITRYIKDKQQRPVGNNIFSIYTDSKNNIWIGRHNSKLQVFNRKIGKIREIEETAFEGNSIRAICEDSKSRLWFGTFNSLFMVEDPEEFVINRFFLDTLPGSNVINCLLESSNKYLWVGTQNGLFKHSNGQFERFDYNDGLPSNSIMGILEDNNKALWVSTSKGLVQFTPIYENTDNRALIKIYEQEDGVQGTEFLENSYCKLSDGHMVFGGTKGFTIFHPDSIHEDTSSSKILFNDFKLFNKSVQIDQEINGQVVLNKSLFQTDTIVLNHSNRDFSIEFTVLNFSQKSKLYAYMLKGYDKTIRYTDAKNSRATYTNLPYGQYTFIVETLNASNKAISEPKYMVFVLLPPWWLTTWFKILSALTIALSVFVWFRLRIYRYKKQELLLVRTVNERTEELEKQKIEIKRISDQLHEADQNRLRLFTNISHEFRTPLTLILGPLENYVKSKQSIDYSKLPFHLNLMYRNAKRLFSLINQLIEIRKVDQGLRKLHVSNNNIVEFLKEIVDAFRIFAEQKDIELLYKFNNENIDFWFDPDIIEKVFYNLLSNAVKYTPEGGKVYMTVSTADIKLQNNVYIQSDKELIVKVSDTGKGIPPEQLDKIFDRYYKVSKDNYVGEGTGIGLAYTKELVELHKGKIEASSILNNGSIFTVAFPLGKNHYSSENFNSVLEEVNIEYTRSMLETYANTDTEFTDIDATNKATERNTKKSDLLIVEDNTDVRLFIKNELIEQYNIIEAANGKEGIEKAIEVIPDIIISDIMMPEVNGITLCQTLKNNALTSHIPIILLTAKAGEDNVLAGLSHGADDYITKPFSVDVLKLKINNILEIRKRIFEKYKDVIDIKPEEVSDNNLEQDFIQKAFAIVEKNHQNPEFDEIKFIKEIGFSKSIVQKKIRNLTNHSVNEFIRAIRLRKAAKLLLEGNVVLEEVCYKVGFKHQTEFVDYFTEMYKKTPSEFLKERS